MAVVKIPEEQRVIEGADQVRDFLKAHGIDYERAEPGRPVARTRRPPELLDAYKDKIEELKARGGYVTADVIDVFPDHAQSRDDAQQIQFRALARRGRGPLHRRGRGPVPVHRRRGPSSPSKSRPAT
jgi:1,2-dihydroxy-3-keto-5-methylthiopentene dioxygenase